MRLVSLMRIMPTLCQPGAASRFSRSAKRAGRQVAHQAQAPGERLDRQRPGHADQGADAALVARRSFADPAVKLGAEAAQAREAELEADLGHRALAEREQLLGAIEPRADPQ